MTQRVQQNSLNWGEISPAFYGRTDLPQYKAGCSVMRNMFVAPQGAAMSRAGTKFVGQCFQTASVSSTPPVLIPFTFSVREAYALEFGDFYMRVIFDGAYVVEDGITLSGVTNANPGVWSTSAAHGLSAEDWVYVASVGGMTEVNGKTYIVDTVPTTGSFTVRALLPGSAPLDTSGFGTYTSGGTVARLFTLTTPYAIADVEALKYTQSVDVMSITHPSYAPYDLARYDVDDWRIAQTAFTASILPPTTVSATASTTTSATVSTQYLYVVTAIDAETGEESVASSAAAVTNSVNIALTLGSNRISWTPVSGASYYNIYKAPPSYGGVVPPGSLYGYMGTSYGLSFVDTNIVQAMALTPPLHVNPFATASIVFTSVLTTGSGFITTSSVPIAVNFIDATGTGAAGYAVVQSDGGLYAVIMTDGGEAYTAPQVVLGSPGPGSGATVTGSFSAGGHWNGICTVTNGGANYDNQTYAVATWTRGGIRSSATVGWTSTVNTVGVYLTGGVTTGGVVQTVKFTSNVATFSVTSGDSLSISIFDGVGSGATVSASLGPTTGTWPSVVSYFQQRRFYGASTNQPDTYWGSQPGKYTNFDSRIPVNDADAIEGTPWAQQINGIQWMIPMPGGLVLGTGLGAWQLNGGDPGAPLTPADQNAQAQGRGGFSPTVRPIPINFDILYVQQEGSIVRDLTYNLINNIYAGTDITLLSNHLFDNFTIRRWDWAQERHKLVWTVRDDGILLSLAYLKEQGVYAWSRHDTQGLFQSVAVVSEPPVDAPYFIVKRLISGSWVYYVERMDNRLWFDIEDAWCLDCALAYPQTEPDATITASQASGDNGIGDYLIIAGGTGYTAPQGTITGYGGVGTGASCSFTLTGGIITGVSVVTEGQDYEAPVSMTITDTTGSGAVVQPIVLNQATLSVDTGVFSAGNVGDIVRMGGGKLEITAYGSSTSVTATILQPITATIPNDPDETPVPQAAGDWTIATPTSTVSGLDHLEGMTVNALADGGVVNDLVVTDGAVDLGSSATAIVVGLPYTVQMQQLYLEPPVPDASGRRSQVFDLVLLVQNSRAPMAGTNQPIAAIAPNFAEVPWANMAQIAPRSPDVEPGEPEPLFTGNLFANLAANWSDTMQVAIQQTDPVPLTLLQLVPSYRLGDT